MNEDEAQMKDMEDERNGGLSDYEVQQQQYNSLPPAPKSTPVTCNKGWQNLRDSKGRFYRKYV
jgi:hypothetical protein